MEIGFPGIFLDTITLNGNSYIEARRVSKTLDFCLFLCGIAIVNMESKENATKLQLKVNEYNEKLLNIRTQKLNKGSVSKKGSKRRYNE
ncbi:MAG: hypothetical protein LBB45_07745 [Methanobrevibacter sp.]|jgi:hypothetical protein|nr:hypothetical protein [Candidatus Methanovirga basalitermitum]